MPRLNLTDAESALILKARAEQALRNEGANAMLEQLIALVEDTMGTTIDRGELLDALHLQRRL